MFRHFVKKAHSLTKVPKEEFKMLQKYIPPKWEPYYRLGRYDKQIGTDLVYIPCTWGLALGQPYLMPLVFTKYAFLMWVGAVVSRSAGCIVNDIWDRDFDKHVERTKQRPLASGELTVNQALAFFVPHVFVGLGVLTQMNWLSIKWILGILPVCVLYPAAKRVTNYPQAVLGTAFNWGIWCGYAAISGTIDYMTCGLTWTAGIAWTLIYDTIYAHQDKNDDIKIGVKSTALAWGENTQKICHLLNALMFGLFSAAGYTAGLNYLFYPALGMTSGYLAKMIKDLDINNRESCNRFFVNNRKYGILMLLTFLIGKAQLDA